MKLRRLGRVAALTLASVMLVGVNPARGLAPLPPVSFSTADLAGSATDWDWNASIDGKLVAWECWIGPAHTDYAIYIHNLATNATRIIGAGDGFQQSNPDVSGNRVVYQENASGNWNVMVYDWTTNSAVNVATTADQETQPRIDGNLVTWKNTTTGALWYRDYSLPMVASTQITAAYANSVGHDVDNGRIWWTNPDFRDFRTAMVQPPRITGQLASFVYQPEEMKVHGDRAVCMFNVSGNDDVMTFAFRPRIISLLANASSAEYQPTVFDATYAWIDNVSGGGDIVYSRPGYFKSTIGNTEQDQRPSLFGHRIAWDRNNGSDWDVVLATGATKLQSRTYGANRYATAAAVSAQYFAAGPNVYGELDNIVLCTGENFPDALSAAPLARAVQSPLLLTRRDSIPTETMAEITRLAPTKIYIIGSDAAVSDEIEDQLGATYVTERIAGNDRYETSALIAAKLETICGASAVYRAFFARGDNFPDALALSPVAASAQGPILLVKTGSVPTAIAHAVDTLNITYGYIAGDTSSVSAATAGTLNTLIAANGALGPCTRWAGANRYETGAAVVNGGLGNRWIDLDTLGVATGTNFPDALSGGAALGYSGSPVILTSGTSLSSAASSFLSAHEYEIGRVDVFGGTSTVSNAVFNAVTARIK